MHDIASKIRGIGLQVAAGLLAVLAVWLLTYSRPWHAMEYKTYDLYTSMSAPHATSLPVVILAIDEPTFQELQLQWPFPRRLHARLVERLAADGAAAIAFDVVFAEPSGPEDDQAFASALEKAGNVVLAATTEMIDSGSARIWTSVMPVKQFLEAGAVSGFAGVVPDEDFVVRRHEWHEDTFAARIGTALGNAKAAAENKSMIEYLGPRNTFDTRSYYQALEPGLLPPGFFKDKIVLIGRSVRTAGELNASHADMFNSPFAATDGDRLFPGVEIQATLLHNWMTGGGIKAGDEDAVIVGTVFLVILLLSAGNAKSPGMFSSLTVLVIIAVAGVSLYLFCAQKLWLSPLFPVAAIASSYCASAFISYAQNRRRTAHIRSMFSQYVPPEVVARLVEQKEILRLGGEVRELSVMFTDLANFTAMSEQLSPTQTVEVLTEYFDTMTPIIHRYGGTVDKFIGDAIMAFWGAPLDDKAHAEHAVRAAIEMHSVMHDLAGRLEARGLPSISMRIGIHTGHVVVGNVGSQQRFSYTAVGDAVNLAARLEGANKHFGTSVLISEVTAALLPPDIQLRPLDTIVVKGKTEPIWVFTPCEDSELRRLSGVVRSAIQEGRWKAARDGLEGVLNHVPNDLCANQLLQRVQPFCQGNSETTETSAIAVALEK